MPRSACSVRCSRPIPGEPLKLLCAGFNLLGFKLCSTFLLFSWRICLLNGIVRITHNRIPFSCILPPSITEYFVNLPFKPIKFPVPLSFLCVRLRLELHNRPPQPLTGSVSVRFVIRYASKIWKLFALSLRKWRTVIRSSHSNILSHIGTSFARNRRRNFRIEPFSPLRPLCPTGQYSNPFHVPIHSA